MRGGYLQREIVIQRKTTTTDAIGHPVPTWKKHLALRAGVTAASGNEVLRAGREVTSETKMFTIRYQTGITAKDRIKYDTKFWDILYIRELGRRRGLEILAELIE